MIERLNFYDVYGYLLPGAALLGVLFLPYWLSGHPIPLSDVALGSAVTSLIVAYLIGHGIQIVGRRIFPESHPSDTLITSEHDGFKEPFKTMLQQMLLKDFDLNIFNADERGVAFNACRFSMQSKDAPSYAEQHQGLYALMRGLAAVSLVGLFNCSGWILGTLARTHPQGALTAAGSLAIGVFILSFAFWPPLSLAFSAPVGLGFVEASTYRHVDATHLQYMVVAAAGLGFAAYAFWLSFKYFQNAFARTVYITYFARRQSPLTTPRATAPAGGA